jgi:hypothetical protein
MQQLNVMQIDEYAYNVCGLEPGRLTLTRVKLTLDCDHREQEKTKVRVMLCAASASPQVVAERVIKGSRVWPMPPTPFKLMATCPQTNTLCVRFDAQWDGSVSQGRTGCEVGKVKGGIGVSGQGCIPGEVRQRRSGRRRSHPRGLRVNQSVDGAACGEVCVALQYMCSKRRNRNILTKKNISDMPCTPMK